jgi:hypothetical protein
LVKQQFCASSEGNMFKRDHVSFLKPVW